MLLLLFIRMCNFTPMFAFDSLCHGNSWISLGFYDYLNVFICVENTIKRCFLLVHGNISSPKIFIFFKIIIICSPESDTIFYNIYVHIIYWSSIVFCIYFYYMIMEGLEKGYNNNLNIKIILKQRNRFYLSNSILMNGTQYSSCCNLYCILIIF